MEMVSQPKENLPLAIARRVLLPAAKNVNWREASRFGRVMMGLTSGAELASYVLMLFGADLAVAGFMALAGKGFAYLIDSQEHQIRNGSDFETI